MVAAQRRAGFFRNYGRHAAGCLSTARVNVVTASLIAVLLSVGCSQPKISDQVAFTDLHPVTGRVKFDGQPMAGGTVRLFPVVGQSENANGEVCTANVSADGSFQMKTFRAAGYGSGVPAGEYAVAFSWSGTPEETADYSADDRPEKLPAKLTSPKTSGIRVTVAAGGTVIPDIDLK